MTTPNALYSADIFSLPLEQSYNALYQPRGHLPKPARFKQYNVLASSPWEPVFPHYGPMPTISAEQHYENWRAYHFGKPVGLGQLGGQQVWVRPHFRRFYDRFGPWMHVHGYWQPR
jgi:hypothetical protein